MIRLSKLTDYAVVLLTQLVRREGGLSTTSILAAETGLPHPTVAKVLKLLAKGEILKAQRGAAGGYVLARPADAISVADIITAIDGPIHLTDCVKGAVHICQMSGNCRMNGHWNRVNHAVREALQKVSLYEMAMDTSPAFRAAITADAATQTKVQ